MVPASYCRVEGPVVLGGSWSVLKRERARRGEIGGREAAFTGFLRRAPASEVLCP